MSRITPKIGNPLDVDLMIVEVVFAVGDLIRLEKVNRTSETDSNYSEYRLSVFWVKIGSWKH